MLDFAGERAKLRTTCLGVTQSEQALIELGAVQQIRRGFLFIFDSLGHVGFQNVIPGARRGVK